MKKLISLIIVALFTLPIFAQTPQKMSYQAIIRNSSNQLVTTHLVGMKISILQGSATGTAVYSETITPTPSTNANGLVSIEIGSGAGFSTIDWANGLYYIKTETDPTGGTTYTITGTSQLLSVPYALYSKTTGQYSETDPIFNGKFDLIGAATGDLLQYNGTKWVRLPKGTDGQILTLQSGVPVWENSSALSNPIAPIATALPATAILLKSATMNGTVNANGFSTNVEFEYGETSSYGTTSAPSQSPVTGNTTTSVNFDCNNCYVANTTYHYRIKANNAVNVTYSNDMLFTTIGAAPSATTLSARGETLFDATLNGTVNANGYSTTVTFEYGTTTGYGSTTTATQSPVTGDVDTDVSAAITGLTAATTYHYRVKAVNSLGTTYGSDMTFTTLGTAPTATTVAVTGITLFTATLNGTVNANYFSTTVNFEYGTTSGYGSTATAIQSPVTGNVDTDVSAAITGLTVATTYHYRVKAVNSLGTTYGSDMTFTTLGAAPTATTVAVTGISLFTATLNGTVNANYFSTTVTFEYGLTTGYGSTATAIQSPVIDNVNTDVSAAITGLTVATTYHYRVKAVNSLGTSYGSDMTFTTNAGYIIGDTYQGGIIFYITGTYPNQHGLVCAPTDQSTGIKWYNGDENTATGATGTALGTGQANTTAIVTVQGAGSYAAKLCDDLDLNSYSDWFLPSLDELTLMYTNLKVNSLGGFASEQYWSSSEQQIAGLAWSYHFNYVFPISEHTFATIRVRAVRAF